MTPDLTCFRRRNGRESGQIGPHLTVLEARPGQIGPQLAFLRDGSRSDRVDTGARRDEVATGDMGVGACSRLATSPAPPGGVLVYPDGWFNGARGFAFVAGGLKPAPTEREQFLQWRALQCDRRFPSRATPGPSPSSGGRGRRPPRPWHRPRRISWPNPRWDRPAAEIARRRH